jgi:DNA-binding ferritin-like protein
MAASAGLPLSLPYDEDHSVLLLSDSEDDETPPANDSPRLNPRDQADAMRKKTQDAAANVPLHPIPAMQSAFAESLLEATHHDVAQKPKLKFGDAKERRAHLLDGEKDEKLHSELWRHRPGQTHHELWKLLAQISFGVYLLLNGIANSNEQVVTILQGHIDEVDEFLETSMEDVGLAVDDVKERTNFLKLPMTNVATFEKMLEDRNFRLQIVTGNEKIEHIISRTTTALEATLEDIDEGLKATKEFAVYLGNQKDGAWREQRPDVIEIFDAMKGNAEGWWKAFIDLQDKTADLDTNLIKLGQMVAEMDQRAGEVSRRTRVSLSLPSLSWDKLTAHMFTVHRSTIYRPFGCLPLKPQLFEVYTGAVKGKSGGHEAHTEPVSSKFPKELSIWQSRRPYDADPLGGEDGFRFGRRGRSARVDHQAWHNIRGRS